jgi:hypothetical protein
MTPQELLAANKIILESTASGRYYTTCPECSHQRSTDAHRKLKCLGVTIDGDRVHWGCNHCGWSGPGKGDGGNGKDGEFAATYDYRDARGVLQFQKVRNPPGSKNRFFLRRPDGRDGWINDVKGVDTSLLYRIDEVTKAIVLGRRIAVVEGEKDADNLWRIGIPATCNAHGASLPGKTPKWTKKHSEQLRGGDIVVFNDNDLSGYEHAEATCRLSHGVAAQVCRLDLAPHWLGMPRSTDVSDWLKAGHTKEQLDALIDAAPEWSRDEPPPPELKPKENGGEGVSLNDFHAYMPQHSYIFVPTREMWPASSVNVRLPKQPLLKPNGDPVLDKQGDPIFIPASQWLDINRAVEQMTWAPGEPMLIRDRIMSEGGWVPHLGLTAFNLYRPPNLKLGYKSKIALWRDHLMLIYPDDFEHIEKWMAHRVQHPEIKINHALVLGGLQGIGKDTMLEPLKQAVGPWNFIEVSPIHVLGNFTGFVKSVVLRISEGHDLGEFNRFQLYERTKTYIAAPPDGLRCNEKHLREYTVPNCTGTIITTNHKTDGIFLPIDDRRHYVTWSTFTKEQFDRAYWNRLWRWYAAEGIANVAAHLATLDLSGFDPKAPPRQTPAFFEIVNANRAPEDAMGNPKATTLGRIRTWVDGEFGVWINDRKNRRAIPHRMEVSGYVPVRNEAATDGLWKIAGARQVIYAMATLSLRDQLAAVNDLLGWTDDDK